MTREDRLDWLCRLRGQLIYFDMPDHWRTNFTHALSDEINDLQQEPCEDFIDRADAMTEIMMFAGNEKNNDDIYIKVSDAVQLLRELPSVQPKQKPIILKANEKQFEELKEAIRKNPLCAVMAEPKTDILTEIEKQEKWLLQAGYSQYNVDIVICTIKSLLTKQEPKTGHWEQYGDSWEDKFKCSKCGEEQPKILCGERIIGHWSDYCPNCGARMSEVSE